MRTLPDFCPVKPTHALVCFLTLTACAGPFPAFAASGTWTNPNGGSWANTVNWSGGIIADGSGNNANFGTLSLPADAIVTLNTARTIGSLTFDDQSTNKHDWTLNTGINGPLTLAGGAP